MSIGTALTCDAPTCGAHAFRPKGGSYPHGWRRLTVTWADGRAKTLDVCSAPCAAGAVATTFDRTAERREHPALRAIPGGQ